MMLRNWKVLKKSDSREINAYYRHIFHLHTGTASGLPAYNSQDSDIRNSFLFYYTPVSHLRVIKKKQDNKTTSKQCQAVNHSECSPVSEQTSVEYSLSISAT